MMNVLDSPELMPASTEVLLSPFRKNLRILTDCSFLSQNQIRKVEDRFRARYVFESQLKLKSEQWSDFSVAVFYSEEPHPRGSNWFGIWSDGGRLMISNAISAVEEPFFGAVAENGDIIYSRHTHDLRESEDKSVFVDGGRAHFRHDLEHEIVKLRVVKDRVVIVPRETRIVTCEVPFTEALDLDLSEI
jgi:hypothetical protein